MCLGAGFLSFVCLQYDSVGEKRICRHGHGLLYGPVDQDSIYTCMYMYTHMYTYIYLYIYMPVLVSLPYSYVYLALIVAALRQKKAAALWCPFFGLTRGRCRKVPESPLLEVLFIPHSSSAPLRERGSKFRERPHLGRLGRPPEPRYRHWADVSG